jgi:hypothetical protein
VLQVFRWQQIRQALQVGQFLAVLAAVVGVYLLWDQLGEQTKANRLDSRGTIASHYRSIADREFDRPELYLALFEYPSGRQRPREWVELSLRRLAPTLPSGVIRSASHLETLLWTPARRGTSPRDIGRLRQVSLHAESYLDFLIDVHGYENGEVITSSEADEWYAILEYPGFACHPVWLYTLSVAEGEFLPEELAKRIRMIVIEDDEICQPVAQYFYPEILAEDWGGRSS